MGALRETYESDRLPLAMTDDPTQEDFSLTAVLLAAGRSERMGEPKQLLSVKGRPLLQHALDCVASSRCREIVLVVGNEADAVLAALTLPSNKPIRVVRNEDFASGQGSSLRAGLQAVSSSSQGVAIFLGDQPSLQVLQIDQLAEQFLSVSSEALRPVYEGKGSKKIPGHPVYLRKNVMDQVLDEVTGDQGLRGVFEKHPSWLCEVACSGSAPMDIDTMEDLTAYIDAETSSNESGGEAV
jgi:molybdenum cofactor cytidylyltransferase